MISLGGNVEGTEHDLGLFLPQRGNARSAFRAKAPSFESPQVSSALISMSRPTAEEAERTAACADNPGNGKVQRGGVRLSPKREPRRNGSHRRVLHHCSLQCSLWGITVLVGIGERKFVGQKIRGRLSHVGSPGRGIYRRFFIWLWFGRHDYSPGLSVGRGVLPAAFRASLRLAGKGSARGLLFLGEAPAV